MDIVCGPTGYSIVYVDSYGLNYAGDGTVHPGYNKHVIHLSNAISNRLQALGGVRPPQYQVPGQQLVIPQPQAEAPYELKSFTRDLQDSYRFEFTLKGSASGGVDVLARIKEELRRLVFEDCRDSVQPGTERQVDFPEFSQSDGRITGRAVLKTLHVVEELEFIYDPDAGVGRMVLAYAPGRVADARKWASDNIAQRMKDKYSSVYDSILSRVGVMPKFSIEGEKSFEEGGKKKLDIRFRLVQ